MPFDDVFSQYMATDTFTWHGNIIQDIAQSACCLIKKIKNEDLHFCDVPHNT